MAQDVRRYFAILFLNEKERNHMKKLCLLFAFLWIAVSIMPFTLVAASSEENTVGKIQIYVSKDACLLLNDKKIDVQGRELYDAAGKPIGSTDLIGSSGRRSYIVNDGTYTVLNSPFVEVQYLKAEGASYVNVGDRIQYDALDASTTCVRVSKCDSKEVTVQALTADHKTLLRDLKKTQNAQNAANNTSPTIVGMFSDKKLSSRTFHILDKGIELALDYSWAFQIVCALILVLFFIAQFFLCVKVKKLFIVKLLPFLCTCGCAMTAVSYLMDYYGTYSANDPGMAMGLVFWQQVVTSMGNGCLFGLIAAVVYQLVRILIRFILKKRRTPKAKENQAE